jgi:predicted GIY-YIG superfamily endonuclease
MERDPAVYIVASGFHGTVYTGVTSNLLQRVYQHREGTLGGFTKRYGCKRLVWFEMHGDMEQAILREKQLKNWLREEGRADRGRESGVAGSRRGFRVRASRREEGRPRIKSGVTGVRATPAICGSAG